MRRCAISAASFCCCSGPLADTPRAIPTCHFDLVQFPSAEAPGISVFYKDKDGSERLVDSLKQPIKSQGNEEPQGSTEQIADDAQPVHPE